MSHERSETIQDPKTGRWINVYGRGVPNAGAQLPGTDSYLTIEEAVRAAKARSKSFDHHEGGNMPGAPDIMAMMNLEQALSRQGPTGGPLGSVPPGGPGGIGAMAGMEMGRMPPPGGMMPQPGTSANFGVSAGGFPMPQGDMQQANTEYLMALIKALKSSIPGTDAYNETQRANAQRRFDEMQQRTGVNGRPVPGGPSIRPMAPRGGVRG